MYEALKHGRLTRIPAKLHMEYNGRTIEKRKGSPGLKLQVAHFEVAMSILSPLLREALELDRYPRHSPEANALMECLWYTNHPTRVHWALAKNKLADLYRAAQEASLG